MKKVIYAILIAALATAMLGGCQDVPEPYTNPNENKGGNQEVPEPGTPTGKGTEADPYNVTAALAKIKTLKGGENTGEIFVKGKIRSVKEVDTDKFYNATYFISDDITKKMDSLQIYRSKYLGNAKFTAKDQIKAGDEVEAVVLTLDRDERKMSLGIKQLREDPWETIEVKYPVGSKHTSKVRNFTNFGIFVELEEGVDGLIHISDLSWTKKVKHPSEFTQVGAEIEVVVLEIDKENRRLSLGHKQLEDNPWDTYETLYTPGSVHRGKISEMMDKGAVITLNEGGEGFATPKHLVKEDGTQAQLGEELEFKVIEFVKETKRIILSHSRTFEEGKDDVKPVRKQHAAKKADASVQINNVAAGTTLGDIDVLADLKAKLEKGK